MLVERPNFVALNFALVYNVNVTTDKKFVQSSLANFSFVLSSVRCDHSGWGGGLSVITGGRHVATASGPVDVNVLVRLKLGVLLSRKDTESMGAKVVTLSLKNVGGDDLAPVTIQERESRRESRGWDTPENGLSDDAPPTGLCLVDG